jgi:Spy/CpxP family protein refolding chaperone
MKRSKQIQIVFGILMVESLLVGSAALAHPGLGPGRMGMMAARTRLLDELQLTTDQKAQIQRIWADGRQTLGPLHQQLREKQRALREAARSEPFDEALVRSQAQEVADLQTQLMVVRAQLINQARSIMTDEQKARLNELREQRLQQFREWRKQHLSRPGQQQN